MLGRLQVTISLVNKKNVTFLVKSFKINKLPHTDRIVSVPVSCILSNKTYPKHIKLEKHMKDLIS
jgi:hypothetical protein